MVEIGLQRPLLIYVDRLPRHLNLFLTEMPIGILTPSFFQRNIYVDKMIVHEYHGVHNGQLVLCNSFVCQSTALHVCYILTKYSLTLLLPRSSFCIVRYFHYLPPLKALFYPSLTDLQRAAKG